jgi:hypothetical protein
MKVRQINILKINKKPRVIMYAKEGGEGQSVGRVRSGKLAPNS